MTDQELRNLLKQAIQDLGINVPVYRYERTENGIRIYLYGRHNPVEWQSPDGSLSETPPEQKKRATRRTTRKK